MEWTVGKHTSKSIWGAIGKAREIMCDDLRNIDGISDYSNLSISVKTEDNTGWVTVDSDGELATWRETENLLVSRTKQHITFTVPNGKTEKVHYYRFNKGMMESLNRKVMVSGFKYAFTYDISVVFFEVVTRHEGIRWELIGGHKIRIYAADRVAKQKIESDMAFMFMFGYSTSFPNNLCTPCAFENPVVIEVAMNELRFDKVFAIMRLGIRFALGFDFITLESEEDLAMLELAQ